MADHYPDWVCAECGTAHGTRQLACATWHYGVCDVCGREEMVTEPRDYGHLKPTWKDTANG